jgi:hypothetical protein
VPDVSSIGDFERGTISNRGRAAINRTLPLEVDQERLWAELDPVIRETRSTQQMVEALQNEIQELESAKQKLAQFIDSVTTQRIQTRIAELQDALRYYRNLAEHRNLEARFKRFRILRAWQAAGGRMTISSPDNLDRMTRTDRRGKGTPGGPLVEYFRTSLLIVCGDDLKPETVKSLLYRDYKKHFHHQRISASLKPAVGMTREF